MSTVPKLTYAKVGKGSKSKAQSASSQLLRSKQQKSNDLFSQMNQQNLNYIKKQLKLKKNRSQQQRPRSPQRDGVETAQQQDQQITQRYKIYQKYRGEEEVSEKQPHLQDTERITEQDKGVNIVLPEQIEEDYDPSQVENSRPYPQQKQFISSSHHGLNAGKLFEKMQGGDNKMYQSLPYQDAKKRISSIEGYFGEAISTNLNRQEGQFIEFLQQYISDLNHSKHLKSRQNEQASIQKRRDGYQNQRKRTISRQGSQRQYVTKIQDKLRQDKKKLDLLNKNSDTFGEHNSKYTVKSNTSTPYDTHKEISQFQLKFKEEKHKSIILAEEIQKMRKLIDVKDQIIKKFQTQCDLMKEQLRHVKKRQQIINNGKYSVPQLQYSNSHRQIYRSQKGNNDENDLKLLDIISSIPHQRNQSNNQKTAYSHRSSFLHENGDIYRKNQYLNQQLKNKQKRNKKQTDSLQKIQREYQNFLLQQKNRKYFRGNKK